MIQIIEECTAMLAPVNTLDNIHVPFDLRRLPLKQLPNICDEVRNLMIKAVSQTGGI